MENYGFKINVLIFGFDDIGIENLNNFVKIIPKIQHLRANFKCAAVSPKKEELEKYIGETKVLLDEIDSNKINSLLEKLLYDIDTIFIPLKTKDKKVGQFLSRLVEVAKKNEILLIYIADKTSLHTENKDLIDFVLDIQEKLYQSKILGELILKFINALTDEGLAGLDYCDVSGILRECKYGVFGLGRTQGDNRFLEAAKNALEKYNEKDDISKANYILTLVTGSVSLGLMEGFFIINGIKEKLKLSCYERCQISPDGRLDDSVEVLIIGSNTERPPQEEN